MKNDDRLKDCGQIVELPASGVSVEKLGKEYDLLRLSHDRLYFPGLGAYVGLPAIIILAPKQLARQLCEAGANFTICYDIFEMIPGSIVFLEILDLDVIR